jgi:hypothetical protein
MQFPVPQFTDVEDRIIANLTLRQFGILFAAGVIIFLFFSATKSVVGTAIVFLLVGVPSLLIAFMKVNGRPLYRTASHLIGFFTHPREMLFHKQGMDLKDLQMFEAFTVPKSEAPVAAKATPSLQEIEMQLEKQRAQEDQLLKKTQLKL